MCFVLINSSIESLGNPRDISIVKKGACFKQILAALMTYNILQYYFYHNIYILTSMPLGKTSTFCDIKIYYKSAKLFTSNVPFSICNSFFFVSIQDKQGTLVFYSCRVKKKSVIPCLIK